MNDDELRALESAAYARREKERVAAEARQAFEDRELVRHRQDALPARELLDRMHFALVRARVVPDARVTLDDPEEHPVVVVGWSVGSIEPWSIRYQVVTIDGRDLVRRREATTRHADFECYVALDEELAEMHKSGELAHLLTDALVGRGLSWPTASWSNEWGWRDSWFRSKQQLWVKTFGLPEDRRS
ncbi:MAG: hypothetical protein AB7Q42_05925 [Acidimicrobiia bacterium]